MTRKHEKKILPVHNAFCGRNLRCPDLTFNLLLLEDALFLHHIAARIPFSPMEY
jgi:hypothetical protein